MTNPRDLQDIAESLLISHPNEHGWRSATNRSYYSIFHLANKVVNDYLVPESESTFGNSHQRLFQSMIDCPATIPEHMKIKALGYRANGLLKPYRQLADYNLEDTYKKIQALDCVAKANDLLKRYDM